MSDCGETLVFRISSLKDSRNVFILFDGSTDEIYSQVFMIRGISLGNHFSYVSHKTTSILKLLKLIFHIGYEYDNVTDVELALHSV